MIISITKLQKIKLAESQPRQPRSLAYTEISFLPGILADPCKTFSRLLINGGTIALLGSKFVKEIIEMAEGVNVRITGKLRRFI